MSKRKQKAPPERKPDLQALQGAFSKFESTTSAAVAISERSVGQTFTGRQRRALIVFTKLIVHNMSIAAIAAKFLDGPTDTMILDHFSVGVLGRASIDAALMTMYISEPSLSVTQWDFRRQLLFLHDANNRSRFLKPLAKGGEQFPFFETKDLIIRGIHDKIRKLGPHLLFSETKIDEYLKGFIIFIDGARGAVREAKWDLDQFEFVQSYLSAYVHTHPVSFINADDQDIRFGGASQFQADFCSFVLTMLEDCTDTVVERMKLFAVPMTGDPVGQLD